MYFNIRDIDNLERFYRANLINSSTGYKPANLIGTVSEAGINNLAIFSSVVHLGSNPALIAFIQRPLTEQSHTYKNIIQNKFFTINHVNEKIVTQSHWTSAKFDENISEYEACKLTPEILLDFKAPFVKESLVQIGLEYVQQIPIELNNTIMIIGKVIHLNIKENALMNNGNINLQKAQSVCIAGLDSYYSTSCIDSLPYAKVNNVPDFE